ERVDELILARCPVDAYLVSRRRILVRHHETRRGGEAVVNALGGERGRKCRVRTVRRCPAGQLRIQSDEDALLVAVIVPRLTRAELTLQPLRNIQGELSKYAAVLLNCVDRQ